MADSSKKRKQTSEAPPAAKRPRFPQRPQHQIAPTATSSAYPNGEINVKNFLKSHENEIKSLENAMKAAKKGLARRAFQEVPREMRRRTASHNPQRVPKRLRTRAAQEAKEDNTPISKGKSGSGAGKGNKKWLRKEGIEKSRKKWEERAKRRKEKEGDINVTVESLEGSKNDAMNIDESPAQQHPEAKPKRKKFAALATPATPSSRFRRRQKNKTWLPTHLWHTKRAHMTPPKEPLWGFAIPLAPAAKAYRLTHRATTIRGAVAWDASYISTIGLEGVEASIVGLLKALHFTGDDNIYPWQERGTGKKWRHGSRVWEGWIYEREGKQPKQIAHVTVIWSVADTDVNKRKAFIRVHPSAFFQLWNEIVRVAKVQKPAIIVEDLRFDIGSIEIMGPAAAESLCSILSPTLSTNLPSDAPQAIWPSLASVVDTDILPANALLAFTVSDPRLRDPPTTTRMIHDASTHTRLTELLANWPVDQTQTAAAIFNRDARLAARRSLLSQKSINRRKGAATLGEYPDPRPTDPQIPMLTYVSKETKSWMVLLPWKCVEPVWRGIMRYPVSTGGNPRFGGLKERRQVNFERSVTSFPFDFPGTRAGWYEELQERVRREHKWTKRPKGKRIEWSTVNLGNGRKGEVGDPWACDWARLLPKLNSEDKEPDKEPKTFEPPFRQIPSHHASALISGHTLSVDYSLSPHLFTVKINMTHRGTPKDCARVYRLPTRDSDLRGKWLCLLPGPKGNATSKRASRKHSNCKDKSAPAHICHKELAEGLLEPIEFADGPPKAGDADYPIVPSDEDLIGFVTTGNYNLAEGRPIAIANLVLARVMGDGSVESNKKRLPNDVHVCIIREAGQNIGRLATWEVI